MATVAITGITGLAGGHVGHALRRAGHQVIGISRRPGGEWAGQATRHVPDVTDRVALTAALEGCDAVFHFADQADRKAYREDHVGAAAAAMTAIRAAADRAGLRRIITASSIFAERTDDPADLYARSKRAMEASAVDAGFGAPALILRLPPLYGPGARGAVRHIARATSQGWPLPFATATAPRRFLSLDSLAELCVHLVELDEPVFMRAAGNVWVPVDTGEGSLAVLSRRLGQGRARLFPVPGIDRFLKGSVSSAQLARDRDALFAAIGWRAG